MSSFQVDRLRECFKVILCSIEVGNLELAKRTVAKAEACLQSCQACPVFSQYGDGIGLYGGREAFVELAWAPGRRT